MNVKQVIVIRRDLKMRRGKEIAQGAHAAMLWLRGEVLAEGEGGLRGVPYLTLADLAWLEGSYKKIVVYVESERELLELEAEAQFAGLRACIVTDLGLTEFNGVPTKTALAIGPDLAEKIDPITGHLPLY